MANRITLSGAVDLHTHIGPSKFMRRVNGYELAVMAAKAGMDAVVLKEHYLPTIYAVPYIQQLLSDLELQIDVIGSIVLNYYTGGFNPFSVQAALDSGAGIIWAPTIDAKHHGEKTEGVGKFLGVEKVPPEYRDVSGLTATNEDGSLKDETRLCIDKVVEAGAVFAIGHLSYQETEAMVRYASEIGDPRIMIDHPLFEITDLTNEKMEILADMGAYLNFPYCGLGPMFRWSSADAIIDCLDHIGIERCVVSSDVGQLGNPNAPEALRIMGELLVDAGLTTKEYGKLVEQNPKKLLGTN